VKGGFLLFFTLPASGIERPIKYRYIFENCMVITATGYRLQIHLKNLHIGHLYKNIKHAPHLYTHTMHTV
jgi:hypothetical protein